MKNWCKCKNRWPLLYNEWKLTNLFLVPLEIYINPHVAQSIIISQRKLAKSGGIPGCLQAAQHLGQSVDGLASSALHGVNCCWPVSDTAVMVTDSSVRSLVHSLSPILMIFRGVSSLAFLMMEKTSMERYGGGGLGASCTSSPSTCFLKRRLCSRFCLKRGLIAVWRKVVIKLAMDLCLTEWRPSPP